MEFEVAYNFETEQQFWDELDETVSKDCPSHDLIDNALRSYLTLTTSFRGIGTCSLRPCATTNSGCPGEYIQSDYDVAQCAQKLLQSELFEQHGSYIRKQIIHCLLEVCKPSDRERLSLGSNPADM